MIFSMTSCSALRGKSSLTVDRMSSLTDMKSYKLERKNVSVLILTFWLVCRSLVKSELDWILDKSQTFVAEPLNPRQNIVLFSWAKTRLLKVKLTLVPPAGHWLRSESLSSVSHEAFPGSRTVWPAARVLPGPGTCSEPGGSFSGRRKEPWRRRRRDEVRNPTLSAWGKSPAGRTPGRLSAVRLVH